MYNFEYSVDIVIYSFFQYNSMYKNVQKILGYLLSGVTYNSLPPRGQGMLSCTIGRISRITTDDITPTQNDIYMVDHTCGW
jgi:hypothetical protein